jgi:sugar lactone lactonase YvrE
MHRHLTLYLASAVLATLALGAPAAQGAGVPGIPPDRMGAPYNTPSTDWVADAHFLKLPKGRVLGSTGAVYGDSKGNIWVMDRCGAANDCAGSKLNMIMEFDSKGNFIKSFGAGSMLFPHGLFIDAHDNLWVTDGHVDPKRKMGDVVLEFSPGGKLLRTLGTPGVAGHGHYTFSEPNAVLVAPDGSIFVATDHTVGKGYPRIVKFDKNGKYVTEWGRLGHGPGEFNVPHSLAMDKAGHLYVADRANNRIQIFTQDGKYLGQMRQFSGDSGIFIDGNDTLYASDSVSRDAAGSGHHPGWRRGIRIGSVKDGIVRAFIPDNDPNPEANSTSGGEGVWSDGHGHIYSAEVGQKQVIRYTRK